MFTRDRYETASFWSSRVAIPKDNPWLGYLEHELAVVRIMLSLVSLRSPVWTSPLGNFILDSRKRGHVLLSL